MDIKYKNLVLSIESKQENDNFVLLKNGVSSTFKARKINDNTLSVLIDGKYCNAYFAENEHYIFVVVDGKNFTFEKIKEEEKSYGGDALSSSDNDIVKPPMPGSIVKILVEKDAKVTEGQGLIIVEAMKMETTLYSSIDGIVKEINVKEGQQVDTDTTLIIIEK